jgi:chromate reductase, NAD(P)H dehydrogenase (quinone)
MPARLMLVCGSTRDESTNLAALRALAAVERPGVVFDLYQELAALPGFVPWRPAPLPVIGLLARITRCDAVVFSTPEYAGGLPGTLKNLLDWTVAGGELYAKPVCWLDVANPGRGSGARAQLAQVLGYVGAQILPDACVAVPVRRSEGLVSVDPAAGPVLRAVVDVLLEAVDDRLERRPSALGPPVAQTVDGGVRRS